MYKCVIFDMDGTLVDSYEGICHAYQWTFEKMKLPFPGQAFVRRAIGAPLPWVFGGLCGMDAAQTARATDCYRDYYARQGRHEARTYEGIPETLGRLRRAGCFLSTATLKNETFARDMLGELGLLPCFDAVYGMDAGDRLTKADLIRRCLAHARTAAGDTVLVGDSEFDAAGARQAGVDFLAVTYGYGFQQPQSLEENAVAMTARTADEIARQLRIMSEAGERL